MNSNYLKQLGNNLLPNNFKTKSITVFLFFFTPFFLFLSFTTIPASYALPQTKKVSPHEKTYSKKEVQTKIANYFYYTLRPAEKVKVILDSKQKDKISKNENLNSIICKITKFKLYTLEVDTFTFKYENAHLDTTSLIKNNLFKVKKYKTFEMNMLISENELLKYIFYESARREDNIVKITDVEIKDNMAIVKAHVLSEKFPRHLLGKLVSIITGDKVSVLALLEFYLKGDELNAKIKKLSLNHYLIPSILYTRIEKEANPIDTFRGFPIKMIFNFFKKQGKWVFISGRKKG